MGSVSRLRIPCIGASRLREKEVILGSFVLGARASGENLRNIFYTLANPKLGMECYVDQRRGPRSRLFREREIIAGIQKEFPPGK